MCSVYVHSVCVMCSVLCCVVYKGIDSKCVTCCVVCVSCDVYIYIVGSEYAVTLSEHKAVLCVVCYAGTLMI